ncbi:MAG: hypothetical protein HOV80_27670 [Polyangiaceae bacterium]|nr:hypothetical protein [Polyangiaceae bacterium]
MARVLPSSWTLPDKISARFGTSAGKQRSMFADGHLVIVTHVVPDPTKREREAALFWRHPDGTWRSGGGARGGLGGLRSMLDDYKKRVDLLEDNVSDAKKAADYFAALQAIAPVHRAVRNLHRALQEAREAVANDRDIIALRDLASDVERTAEIAHADAKSGLEFAIAHQAEEQSRMQQHIARSSHKLNLIAAMFLPITAVGTIFGVNLRHGMETTYAPFLFWGLLAAAFLLGLLVRAGIDKRDAG